MDFSKSKILTYHKIRAVNVVNLERQIKIISGKRIWIAVDDGDVSFYLHMFPLLIKYKIPAILFIITSLIDSDKPFWWDEVIYHLGEKEGKNKIKSLKSISNYERMDFLKTLRDQSKKLPFKYPQLKIAQLLEMQEAGIQMGNHSHTHPMFDQCSDQELRDELRASKDFFERNDLHGYTCFAYPNGNYDNRTEQILKEEGIKQAFLFDHQVNKARINLLRISRLSVNDDTPIWKFRFILSGWHSRLLPFIKWTRNLFS